MLLISSCLLLLFCLVIFLFLWRGEGGRYFVATPFLIFALFEIIIVWPGTLYAYFAGISRDAFPVFVAALGFTAFLMGFAMFGRCFKNDRYLPRMFRDSAIADRHSDSYYLIGVLWFSIVLVAMGLYLYQGIPPQTKAIIGRLAGRLSPKDVADYMSAKRFEITKSYYFGGTYRGQGFLRVIMFIGWSYLLSLGIFRCAKARSRLWKRRWFCLTSILFFLCFVFVTGDGTRAPFLYTLAYLLVFLSLNFKIKFSNVLIWSAASFLVLLGISFGSGKAALLLNQPNPLRTASAKIVRRITLGNSIHNVHIIELIRSGELDYRLGEVHFQSLLRSIPGASFGGKSFSNELANLISTRKGRTTTYASKTYLGIIYVDFGLPGVICLYALMGAFIGCVQRYLFTRRKVAMSSPLLTFAVFFLGRMAGYGFIGFLTNSMVAIGFYIVFKVGADIWTAPSRKGWPMGVRKSAGSCSFS